MSGSPENDGEDLESERRCQDLVANLAGNLVANLVDIRAGSAVHWRLAFITTGDYAGLRVQQGCVGTLIKLQGS